MSRRAGRTRAGARLGRACLSLVAAFVALDAGCAMVAGVDFDAAHPAEVEGGGGITPQSADGAVVFANDGASSSTDAGPPTSSCTPEPSSVTCAEKCGATTDNCNGPRMCPPSCGLGRTCNAGKCECVSDPAWCTNRCGDGLDNCGRAASCAGCSTGVECTGGACGCTPEPTATTCGAKECGTATNNCGQTVVCGKNGQCAVAQAVCTDKGTCCADDTACNGRCGGVGVTNACGLEVGCPAQCPAGQVCVGTSCCVPDPVATTCNGIGCGPRTNNCGQVVTCPDTCVLPNACGVGAGGVNSCGCTPNDPCGVRCAGSVVNSCGVSVTCNTPCWDVCPCRGGTCKANGFCTCQVGVCL